MRRQLSPRIGGGCGCEAQGDLPGIVVHGERSTLDAPVTLVLYDESPQRQQDRGISGDLALGKNVMPIRQQKTFFLRIGSKIG